MPVSQENHYEKRIDESFLGHSGFLLFLGSLGSHYLRVGEQIDDSTAQNFATGDGCTEAWRSLKPNRKETNMITVMGATGHTGKKITEALLNAGEKVRALA